MPFQFLSLSSGIFQDWYSELNKMWMTVRHSTQCDLSLPLESLQVSVSGALQLRIEPEIILAKQEGVITCGKLREGPAHKTRPCDHQHDGQFRGRVPFPTIMGPGEFVGQGEKFPMKPLIQAKSHHTWSSLLFSF